MIRQKINLYNLPILLLVMSLITSCAVQQDSPITKSWESGGLKVILSSPKNFYEYGETVLVQVSLENIGSETIILTNTEATTDYVFDANIDGVNLSSIYPELAVHSLEIKAGEKMEFEYSHVPPANGNYSFVAIAYIYTHDGMLRENSSIIISYDKRLNS